MTDATTIRAVVYGLIAFALIGLLGLIYLIRAHVEAEALVAVSGLAGAALGSLGTLLASTKSTPDPLATQAVKDARGAGVEAGKAEVIEALQDPVVEEVAAAKRSGK